MRTNNGPLLRRAENEFKFEQPLNLLVETNTTFCFVALSSIIIIKLADTFPIPSIESNLKAVTQILESK